MATTKFDIDEIEKEIARWFKDRDCDTAEKRYAALPELLDRYYPIAIESPTVRACLRVLWRCRASGEPPPADVGNRVLPPLPKRGPGRKPEILAFQRSLAEGTVFSYELRRREFEEASRKRGDGLTPKHRAALELYREHLHERCVDAVHAGAVRPTCSVGDADLVRALRWLDDKQKIARKSRRARLRK